MGPAGLRTPLRPRGLCGRPSGQGGGQRPPVLSPGAAPLGIPTYCLAAGSEHFWGGRAAALGGPAASALGREMFSLETGPVGSSGLLGGWSSRSTSSWKPATIGFPPGASPSLQRRGREVRGRERYRVLEPLAATGWSLRAGLDGEGHPLLGSSGCSARPHGGQQQDGWVPGGRSQRRACPCAFLRDVVRLGCLEWAQGRPCRWGRGQGQLLSRAQVCGSQKAWHHLTFRCPERPRPQLSPHPSGGLRRPGSCGQGHPQEQIPRRPGLSLGPLQQGPDLCPQGQDASRGWPVAGRLTAHPGGRGPGPSLGEVAGPG